MIFPEYENRRTPEGHYLFRLREETVLEEFTYKSNGEDRTGNRLNIVADAQGENGEFLVRDSLFPWDTRYRDFLAAMNIEHGRDIDPVGMVFEGDIKYEPGRKDPTKSWPRIINILPYLEGSNFPEDPTVGGDDTPF